MIPTLIFGVLATVFYFKARSSDSQLSALSASLSESDKSIAVLPLTNLSPDAENAFFAGGVHEDILTNLSKVKSLKVISRTSMMRYVDTDKSMKEIGEELDVRFIMEGSVRRAGDQVKITVQLIDSREDNHIWADNYDRNLDDIFAIQAEIAEKVARELVGAISPEEQSSIEEIPTDNLLAYDFYLQAKDLANKRGASASLERIELYNKAVDLDPGFAKAWGRMAVTHLRVYRRIDLFPYLNEADAEEHLKKAHQCIQISQALSPIRMQLQISTDGICHPFWVVVSSP